MDDLERQGKATPSPSNVFAPVPLKRIVPTRPIQLAFWGLRIYIAVMLALVVVGFIRGLH
jgi:hypothetical protein